MTITEARHALMALQRKMAAYDHAVGLIYYDGCTYAPKNTAENRATTMSILSEEIYRQSTSEETVELLEFLDAHKDELSSDERRMVYLLLKDIRDMKKIPPDEYIAYQELLIMADDVWHRAKEDSDFELFRPYLEQIFDTHKRFAKYIEPDKDPFDHWLAANPQQALAAAIMRPAATSSSMAAQSSRPAARTPAPSAAVAAPRAATLRLPQP